MTDDATEPEAPAAHVSPTEGLSTAQPAPGLDAPTRLTPTSQLPGGDNAGPVPGLPAAGQRFHDFDLLAVLGTGAFGRVYLARQVSLGRQVALKVSANRGSEARTLASLEHGHIVQVFSETVDAARNLRLLCMQFVPGTTLELVLAVLAQRDPRTWGGRTILEIIDLLSRQPAMFDPAALRDREFLGGCDFAEAVCWLGARLAEALAHAHSQGVLHRDIKPANILLNRYGRPFLADFNIALDPQRVRGATGEVFGGTLAYMAPEHLDAFNREANTPPDAVDARSDIYSFGVVLFELLAGRRPFADDLAAGGRTQVLRGLAAERRRGPPPLPSDKVEVPAVLGRVVRRCLEPEPPRRYQSPAELARALRGCLELRRVDRELPPPTRLGRGALRSPFAWLIVFALLPHVLGSVVNITYNALRIVDDLTPGQQAAFGRLVLGYNLLVYPLAVWLVCRQILPVYAVWKRLTRGETLDPADVAAARRRALRLPLWAIILSCLGWLPGGVLFPLGLDLLAGPVPAEVFGHFLVSFTISGLIAMTYSYFAVQFAVLRVLYPRLWVDGQGMRATAHEELRALDRRLRLFQLFAGLIPLAGALLLIGVGPEQVTVTFRLLATGLIALGMAGFCLALMVSSRLEQTLNVLLTKDVRAAPPSAGPA